MSKKKILMLIGDYVEDYEVMVAYQALMMVGHTVRRYLHPRFRRRSELHRKARPQFPTEFHVRRSQSRRLRRRADSRWPRRGIHPPQSQSARHGSPLRQGEKAYRLNLPRRATPRGCWRPRRQKVQRLSGHQRRGQPRQRHLRRPSYGPGHNRRHVSLRPRLAGPSQFPLPIPKSPGHASRSLSSQLDFAKLAQRPVRSIVTSIISKALTLSFCGQLGGKRSSPHWTMEALLGILCLTIRVARMSGGSILESLVIFPD